MTSKRFEKLKEQLPSEKHTVVANVILKDKFWIVEDQGKKIGTLSFNDDRYIFSTSNETCFFDDTKQLKKKYNYDIVWNNSSTEETSEEGDFNIHGYPTSVKPFNVMYNVKRKLPLFTKSEKSNSVYCAGFYIIHFDKGWVKSFCPKLITVERYETRGPFKTDLEMRQELSRANR